MTQTTNGYLLQQITKASEDVQNADHGRAQEYLAKFRALEKYFLENIHPQVDVGLALDSASAPKDGDHPDIMTIHGCRHVSDLVDSLDKLGESIANRQGDTELDAYESYILLCAAHLHDAGNIGGRQKHPERSRQLIMDHRDLFYGTDSRQNIYDVARVHGGVDETYGKDTFRHINSECYSRPRLRLLAAMLRMGDELSENPERVPSELLKWFQASGKSNLAYRYAACFSRFDLQNDTLNIELRVYPEQHTYFTEIDGNRVDFFDHLEKKVDVIEREARYCSQYGRPYLDVRRVHFTVEYHSEAPPSKVSKRSKLTLYLDHGYPGDPPPLAERCEEMDAGTSLRSYIRGSE